MERKTSEKVLRATGRLFVAQFLVSRFQFLVYTSIASGP